MYWIENAEKEKYYVIETSKSGKKWRHFLPKYWIQQYNTKYFSYIWFKKRVYIYIKPREGGKKYTYKRKKRGNNNKNPFFFISKKKIFENSFKNTHYHFLQEKKCSLLTVIAASSTPWERSAQSVASPPGLLTLLVSLLMTSSPRTESSSRRDSASSAHSSLPSLFKLWKKVQIINKKKKRNKERMKENEPFNIWKMFCILSFFQIIKN